MPQFTQWNVPDPFPNILYNPAAVDAAIARTQSELGNLDINRRELALKENKFAQGLSLGDEFAKSITGDGTAGTTGAGVGGTYAPGTLPETPQLATVVAPGGAKFQVAATAAERFQGLVTDLEAEGYKLDPATSGGYNKRFIAGTQTPSHHAYGTAVDVNWSRNPQGGTSSDIPADLARRLAAKHGLVWGGDWSGKTRDPMHFEAPRGASAAAPPVVAAPVVPAPVANPNAGPRVGAAPTVPAVTPAIAPSADPNARVEADDPNTQAVKQASAALLNMPEPDAAAAYPAVVRELQARGFAMQAPPTYPGHEALQALVGGVDAVAQTKTAMRLGGTDVAGPGAGQATVPPGVQPNQLAYGTGLPGVTIGLPTNGMAPPAATAAPVVTAAAPAQAQPQNANPQTQPPPAPSRVISREPLIQSGMARGLRRDQALNAARLFKSGADPAAVLQHIDQLRHQNDVIRQGDATQAAIDEKENYARRKAVEQTAFDRTEKAKADAIAAAREAREVAKAEEEKNARIKGDALANQQTDTLIRGTESGETGTAKYAAAYTGLAAGRQNTDGSFVKPNMGAYAKPTFIPPGATEVPDYGKQDVYRPPEAAPQAVIGGILTNANGQEKMMLALSELDKYGGGVGPIALQPNFMSQHTDPAGVPVRAAITRVGAHEFHTLLGATQTPSESSRVRPFVVDPTDSAEAIRTKLKQGLDLIRQENLKAYRAYGPEAGGRRYPVVEEAILATIPQEAMDALLADPKTHTREFDKKYGKGASKLVLQ